MNFISKRFWSAAGLAAGLAMLGSKAAPALVGVNGGITLQVFDRSETTASTSSSTSYVNIPGTALGAVNVPSGATRLITGRFTAESQCAGGAPGNWCSIRIIAVQSGVITELNPASGLDFAFDSVAAGGDDFWESNTVQRSKRLTAGTYVIVVQQAVTNSATVFRLDDWDFRVEVNQ